LKCLWKTVGRKGDLPHLSTESASCPTMIYNRQWLCKGVWY